MTHSVSFDPLKSYNYASRLRDRTVSMILRALAISPYMLSIYRSLIFLDLNSRYCLLAYLGCCPWLPLMLVFSRRSVLAMYPASRALLRPKICFKGSAFPMIAGARTLVMLEERWLRLRMCRTTSRLAHYRLLSLRSLHFRMIWLTTSSSTAVNCSVYSIRSRW